MKFNTGSVDVSCSCAERNALFEMVDSFAEEMKRKLASKLEDGRHGWDDEGEFSLKAVIKELLSHIDRGDPVDVANFACFWWNRLDASALEKYE